MSIKDNLETVKKNIESACKRVGRNPEDITIIGVTKYVSTERADELLDAGVIDIGENRTEEFVQKYEKLGERANWHFIGTLQSRKVRDIIGKVTMIHSLERASVAKQINNRSEEVIPCFIQVNVSGEDSKHGLEETDLLPFIEQLAAYEKVKIVGLMTMAPHVENEDELRAVFKRLAKLRDDIKAKQIPHAPCEFLSMGMSNDYEIAIEEGATHIRIGSVLVG
ncbi:MAG TPA: YggS family pyridoxal phosphate-dependent enzyme [Pseudogracilibacillus sp.]|nr:YggS family pyridoxal phosphate-dependent enzyme [Pseudogracilibacillus sp.]